MAKDYIEEVRKVVISRGGECLSKRCQTTKSKITIRCNKYHTWEVSFNNLVYKNRWCKKCVSISSRNTILDAQILAESKNGKCVSNEYINNLHKLEWSCKNGHIFFSSYNKVSQGRWCPICSKKAKHTINVAERVAKNRGGKCLSKEYKNSKSKLIWQCSKNHIWKATLNNVKNKNKWCRKCYENGIRKYCKNDLLNYARGKGGRCLINKYINYTHKYRWQCCKGHLWMASWSSVKSGTWCPKCRSVSQNILLDNIKKIYPNTTICDNYTGFDWLVNDITGRKLEIDIWIKEIKTAIEYDGQGHFYPVNFGGCSNKKAKKIFEKVKYRDNIKNRKINDSNDIQHFIRFNYKEPIWNLDYVKNKLSENGILGGV